MATSINSDRPANLYDNAHVDVESLFRDKTEPLPRHKNPLLKVYGSRLLPLKLRRWIWLLLNQTHIDLFWFHDFKKYWSQALGLRALWGVEDFYFLRGHYRIKFQNLEVPDTEKSSEHLAAWQDPSTLYFLLHQVYVESKYRDFEILRILEKNLPRRPLQLLEYGSGLGPITQTILDFNGYHRRHSRFEVVDLKNIAFHYACRRFAKFPNVRCIPLEQKDDFQLATDRTYDAIFCITVFEHLNSPLLTAKRFHSLLKPGGLLFFDFVKSEGSGLDTKAGVDERSAVLDFLSQNFTILGKPLDRSAYEKDLGLTVGRKK